MPEPTPQPAKDWKAIASASGLDLPPDHLARIAAPLEALDAAFRPLTREIPLEIEPSIILSEAAVDPE